MWSTNMNENKNNLISRILPKKKKYRILIGIYLLCLVIGIFADPWSTNSGDSFIANTVQDQVLEDIYEEEYPFFVRPDYGFITKLFMKIQSFGMEDIVACYDEYLMDNFTEIITVTFPLIMMIKIVICKRLFKKEKDRVELDGPKKRRLRLLYYRSENIFAEVLADNIAFFVIGIVTRLISVVSSVVDIQSIMLESILIIIYYMLLVITLPIYTATAFLLGLLGFAYGIVFSILPDLSGLLIAEFIVPFILITLLNLACAICFELMLRIVMRIYEAVFQLIKNIIKKLTNTIEVKFNGKPKPDQGGQKYENT